MSKKEKYEQLAKEIVQCVGGKDNISFVTHCMTRLRLSLKDSSLAQTEQIKKIQGVLGVQYVGGQLQIILGQTVQFVYQNVCELGDFAIEEHSHDQVKEKLNIKTLGMKILDGLAGCMTPLIPIMISASIFKMLTTVLGPMMLNVLSESSDLYILFAFVGDAGFYFLPIFTGYTAAKKFGTSPILGMFLGAILIHPTLLEFVAQSKSLSIYGMPASLQNYTSSILPIIMSVWVMKQVEKILNKIIPNMLSTVFVPTLTIAIMLPVSLCVLGPSGAFVGQFISGGLLSLSQYGGLFTIISIAMIGALWQILVMTGMHVVLMSALFVVFSSTGSDTIIMPGALVAGAAVYGMCLGAILRIKNKQEKSLVIGYFISCCVGGVTEPAMYGLGLRFKRPLIGMVAGGFVGGIIIGIFGVTVYNLIPVANVLHLASYVGGSTMNIIIGVSAEAISVIVAAIVTYFFGFAKDDPLVQKSIEEVSK